MTLKTVLLLMSLFVFSVLGCEPRILPSRSMTINLDTEGATHHEVADIVDSFMHKNEFSRLDKDGYEELSRRSIILGYQGTDGAQVSVDLSHARTVYIRMNVRTEQWNEEVDALFEELAAVLDLHWPSSVQKEPSPLGLSKNPEGKKLD